VFRLVSNANLNESSVIIEFGCGTGNFTVIKKKDPRFEGLKKSSVKSIRVLSALLRLAEGLDRSRAGIISHVRFYIVSTKTVVLEMHAQRECQLELWEVENQIKYFKKIFGYNLSCKVLFEPSPRYLEAKDEKRT
ncbi:MAG: hypothetical protein PHU28_05745, partial [Methanosarcinaceae archaeon]|nr:hypothetical protein [Methanosarcinaceae archaeon]